MITTKKTFLSGFVAILVLLGVGMMLPVSAHDEDKDSHKHHGSLHIMLMEIMRTVMNTTLQIPIRMRMVMIQMITIMLSIRST